MRVKISQTGIPSVYLRRLWLPAFHYARPETAKSVAGVRTIAMKAQWTDLLCCIAIHTNLCKLQQNTTSLLVCSATFCSALWWTVNGVDGDRFQLVVLPYCTVFYCACTTPITPRYFRPCQCPPWVSVGDRAASRGQQGGQLLTWCGDRQTDRRVCHSASSYHATKLQGPSDRTSVEAGRRLQSTLIPRVYAEVRQTSCMQKLGCGKRVHTSSGAYVMIMTIMIIIIIMFGLKVQIS